MKKYLKIVIILVILIVLSLIIDLVCIFTISRPIFAIQTDKDIQVYKGLFFDTYNCLEYSIPQIKRKGVKFSCSTLKVNIGRVLEIVDTTKKKKDFTCAEALEEFYEDDAYKYYYSCIKSKYIIVKYENGYEETVSDALKNKTIRIEDLDRYNINYIKYEKNK